MTLDYSDRKLSRYFDALFVVGRMGNSQKELANLQKVMPAEDYAELQAFDKKHHEILSFISRDEDDYVFPVELDKLNDYENIADNINIAPQYKVKMYDYVLTGIDKFAPNSAHSLILIGKMVDNVPYKNRDYLKLLQRVAERYSRGIYNYYEKIDKKIKLKLKRKDPKEVELSRIRFNEISAELKLPHSGDERITLLKEQIEITDKCAFKKMAKFQTKASLYNLLASEYAYQKDIFNHDEAAREVQYYQKLVQNIKDHTK